MESMSPDDERELDHLMDVWLLTAIEARNRLGLEDPPKPDAKQRRPEQTPRYSTRGGRSFPEDEGDRGPAYGDNGDHWTFNPVQVATNKANMDIIRKTNRNSPNSQEKTESTKELERLARQAAVDADWDAVEARIRT